MISNPDLNPNHKDIQVLRTFTKQDPEYDIIKKKLQCFTPNASFSGYVNGKNVASSSGYVFVDFDTKDDKDGFNKEQELSRLRDNQHVYASWTSAGGNGIGCLMKVDWMDNTRTTFKHAFRSAFDTLASCGSDVDYVDLSCSDITRVNFISSSDVFIREDAVTIEKSFKEIEGDFRSSISSPNVMEYASPSCTTDPPKFIRFQSVIDDWLADEPYRYYVEGKPFISIYTGQNKIPVGSRASRLFLICCKLATINPGISEGQLFYHVREINRNYCVVPLGEAEVMKSVRSVLKTYREGNLYAPSRLKYVWFNPAQRFSPREKQSIAAKIMSKHRKNLTFELLENNIYDMRESGVTITQKALATNSGMSVRTVKRYWADLKQFIL